MNILFLGSAESPVYRHLERCESSVQITDKPIYLQLLKDWRIGFAVSHGYRHIVPRSVISHLTPRIINLHIAFLPWNRGADPNLWSVLDNTPAGVTIHIMDEGLDTGPILLQKQITFSGKETLRSSYDRLQSEILTLFTESWGDLREGKIKPRPQMGAGSTHRLSDKVPYADLLSEYGWDTPVEALYGKALKKR